MQNEEVVIDTLPFEKNKQLALLGHAISFETDTFFLQIKDRVKPEWFIDIFCGKVYATAVDFFKKYNRTARSEMELQCTDTFVTAKTEEKNKINAVMLQAKETKPLVGVDVLTLELTHWLKCRVYQERVTSSTTLYNKKNFSKALALLEEAVKECNDISFDGIPPTDFSNPNILIDKMEFNMDSALTTGIKILDRVLLPDGKEGGLLPGDTSIILAPVNSGKTTCLSTMALANVKKGKNVLFLTHEGNPHVIQRNFWLNLMDSDYKKWRQDVKDPLQHLRIQGYGALLNQHLDHIHYVKSGMTVEQVISIIRTRNMQKASMNSGHGYDLLICDYPSLLTPEIALNGKMERRDFEERAYRAFINVAQELNIHALLAVQTNRKGFIDNRGNEKKQQRMITMGDVADSFGIVRAAYNVISLNRTPQDAARDRLIYHVCKTRTSEVGVSVACRSNYRHATTHSDTLGGASYKSDELLSDVLDELMITYKDQEIPATALAEVRGK